MRKAYTYFWTGLALLLGASTFFPGFDYGSLLMIVCWALVAGGLIYSLLRSRRAIPVHISLLVILLGGLISRLSAREGTIQLSVTGPALADWLDTRGDLNRFEQPIALVSFDPHSYRTILSVGSLEVNKPLRLGPDKLYIKSFTDADHPIIGVRRDRAGSSVTFCGYALFLLGGLLMLLPRRRRLAALASTLLLLPTLASAKPLPVIAPQAADSLAHTQVAYNGRMTSFGAVASDFMQKVYGHRSFHNLPARRVVLSISCFPEQWADVALIKTPHGVRSLRSFFDAEGNYTLNLAKKGADQVDERVGLMLLLTSGRLFESSEGLSPLSPAQVEAELIYSDFPWSLLTFISLFIAAGVSFWRPRLGLWLSLFPAILLPMQIGIQLWLTNHGPFASITETLQLLALILLIAAWLLRAGSAPVLTAAACVALVAHLQRANPIMTPIMPVLHSPWLSIHVSLVMAAYALLSMVSVMAIFGISRRNLAGEMKRRCRRLLPAAVWLLGLGIFSGAVWADVSWGRYWGWDPKETWALVTMMLYCVPLHRPNARLWEYAAPLAAIAMTYFGVNLLPSLHAY